MFRAPLLLISCSCNAFCLRDGGSAFKTQIGSMYRLDSDTLIIGNKSICVFGFAKCLKIA